MLGSSSDRNTGMLVQIGHTTGETTTTTRATAPSIELAEPIRTPRVDGPPGGDTQRMILRRRDPEDVLSVQGSEYPPE